MSKIRDTLSLIQSGARSNKYRILFPLFGEEIDILCHASSNPGREIGTVDVFLKGRKYTMAGDISDEGSWAITIYNTEDFLVRSFFLKVISGIQNFDTPDTIGEGGTAGFFSGLTSLDKSYEFLDSIGMADLSDTMNTINNAYNEMRSNWYSVSSFLQNPMINDPELYNPIGTNHSLGFAGRTYAARPWYMSDIIVQQLDNLGEPITETRLMNAFASSVGGIEYTDEVGTVSTTEITFTFSGIEYGVNGSHVVY